MINLLIQEEELVTNSTFLTPEATEAGAAFLPDQHTMAPSNLDFEYYHPNLNRAKGIYPGEDWCNPLIPHAKWHLETGIGLTDLLFLADEFHKILK